MRLTELPLRKSATVDTVDAVGAQDTIAQRLRDLGFVSGEPLSIVATGPVARDPLLVQIGSTRFALRRSEAERVWVATE